MPASKFVNVLAILRKTLSLKQGELAELAGCSVSTIQAIEVNKLQLSRSLAARISVTTGANLEWLLANDVAVPMPPLSPRLPYRVGDSESVEQQDYAATVDILIDAFCRLFAAARRLPPGSRLGTLQLIIANELVRLRENEKADPAASPFFWGPRELFQYFKSRTEFVDPELTGMLDLDYLIRTANPQADLDFVQSMSLKPPPLSPSELKKMKAVAAKSRNRRKDQRRTRQSA